MIVHRDGIPLIVGFWIGALVLWLIWQPFGVIGVVLATWCVWFFRDPDRVTSEIPGVIVSPADGRCLPVVTVPPPAELEMGDAPMTRISIFMNVFDVHVNRIPADGTIEKIAYHPGKFFNASLDKASIHNERSAVRLRNPSGETLAFVQIAGLVARRICSSLHEGQKVTVGTRFGLIRFGSRLDVYLPSNYEVLVAEGQYVRAGETILAKPLAASAAAPQDRTEAAISADEPAGEKA